MSSLVGLLVVALVNAGALIWLVNYLPLTRRKVKEKTWYRKERRVIYYSPRLWLVDQLWVLDCVVSIILILGPIFGFSLGGIQTLIFNTFVALGLTIGVIIITKVVKRFWIKKYYQQVEEMKKGD